MYFEHDTAKTSRTLQVVNFCRPLATCQQFATNLSISSSSNKSVKITLVVTFHSQTSYNLLKQLAASLWITSFDSQLATSLLTTCNKLVVNNLSQAMRTYPDTGLLITSPLENVNKLVTTCAFLAADWTIVNCQTVSEGYSREFF